LYSEFKEYFPENAVKYTKYSGKNNIWTIWKYRPCERDLNSGAFSKDRLADREKVNC